MNDDERMLERLARALTPPHSVPSAREVNAVRRAARRQRMRWPSLHVFHSLRDRDPRADDRVVVLSPPLVQTDNAGPAESLRPGWWATLLAGRHFSPKV